MHYKNASVHCIGKWLMQCPLKGRGGPKKWLFQVKLAPWETAISVALD